MKKFLMLFAVFAVFILPSNFCAAKNYVPVYYSDWNNFCNDLKKNYSPTVIRLKGKGVSYNVKYSTNTIYFRDHNTSLTVFSNNINRYIDKIHITENKGLKSDWSDVLATTFYTIGLSEEEYQYFLFQFIRSLENTQSNKFKKKFSIYCTQEEIYLEIEIKMDAKGNEDTKMSIRAYKK